MRIWSKEEAWRPRPHEKSIPIDRTQHDFIFRRKWFHHRNCCTFSTFLPDRFPSYMPWNVLTIGVFEAAQEVWLMQNILKHPKSRLIGIDPWIATSKLDSEFMEMCLKNARHNLQPWEHKAQLIRGYSQDILQSAIEDGGLYGIPVGGFDLLIIDGDHNADPVLQDAKLCFQLARPNGWLLFDDVRNNHPKKDHVKDGLEKFFQEPEGKLIDFVWAHRFCDCYSKKY